MPVYIVAIGPGPYETDRPVKIGWTRNFEQRAASLQASNSEPIVLLRLIEGTSRTEAWLHRHFEARHLRREWFALCPEMLTVEPPPFPADAGRLSRQASADARAKALAEREAQEEAEWAAFRQRVVMATIVEMSPAQLAEYAHRSEPVA